MDGNLKKETKRGVSRKAFAVLLAAVLAVGCAVGGTIAWLVAKSDTVENTFTYGDINIELEESTGEDYKIVPGCDIAKDPKVTVTDESEDCYLFVKIEETNWPNSLTESVNNETVCKVRYGLVDGWTKLETDDNSIVYYRTVTSETEDREFSVLADDKVVVSENLTKADVAAVKAQEPKLTFTAYAVQRAKNATESFTAHEAWEKVKAETDAN